MSFARRIDRQTQRRAKVLRIVPAGGVLEQLVAQTADLANDNLHERSDSKTLQSSFHLAPLRASCGQVCNPDFVSAGDDFDYA
jgi:hypothetical protein